MHRAALHDLMVDSSWLSIVVNSLFFHHYFCLGLVDGNEAGRSEIVVARSHDVFSFNRS